MPRSPREPSAGRHDRASQRSHQATRTVPKRSRRAPLAQRERLVDAMIELSAKAGHNAVSNAEVSARAGVSTETFYEEFADKEDCLLAAYRECAERVFGHMRAVGDGDWSEAARAALGGLLSVLGSDPDAGRVLFVEGLAGGWRLREERRRVLGEFERRVQEFLESPRRTA